MAGSDDSSMVIQWILQSCLLVNIAKWRLQGCAEWGLTKVNRAQEVTHWLTIEHCCLISSTPRCLHWREWFKFVTDCDWETFSPKTDSICPSLHPSIHPWNNIYILYLSFPQYLSTSGPRSAVNVHHVVQVESHLVPEALRLCLQMGTHQREGQAPDAQPSHQQSEWIAPDTEPSCKGHISLADGSSANVCPLGSHCVRHPCQLCHVMKTLWNHFSLWWPESFGWKPEKPHNVPWGLSMN